MKLRYTLTGAIVALLLAIGLQVAIGSPLLQQALPFIVDIQQQIPFEAVVPVTLEDGTTQTVTVPLNLDLNLQIGLSDAQTVTVTADTQPQVTVSTPPPTAFDDILLIPVSQTQEVDGLTVTLDEIAFTPYSDEIAAELEKIDYSYAYIITDGSPPLIGRFSLSIENTTESTINIGSSYGGVIIVGTEQIPLDKYSYFNNVDDLYGSTFPGVIKNGEIYFPIFGTSWAEIQNGARFIFIIDENRADDPSYTFTVEIPPQTSR